ncbi:MAG: ABC transporter permease [Gemmatimonadota bacterium]|nr:ABC transporter permease [Gemmatimonadota bacterium]
MIGYAVRQFRRGLGARPLLFLLTVSGVAIGVASVVTVQLLNQGAVSAFREGLAITSGGADLVVRPRGPRLETEALVRSLGTQGVKGVTPVQSATVRIPGESDESGRYLEILGLDLLVGGAAMASTVQGVQAVPDSSALSALVTRPSIALSRRTAADLLAFLGRPVEAGDSIAVGYGARSHVIEVAVVLPGETSVAFMDLAWSQHLFGDGLSQLNIDVGRNSPAASDAGDTGGPQDGSGAPASAARTTQVEAVAASLERRLGPGVRITSPSEEGVEGESLLSAFRLNLTALSLISVFVGAFLVYGTTRASLVRRRGELGILRSLGASRAQLLGLVSAEVALLGLAGVVVGLPAGYAAAYANLDAVSGTITNLYLLEAIRSVPLPTWIVALAVGVGLVAAAAGGALPAAETVNARIRTLLSGGSEPVGRVVTPRLLAGGAFTAAAVALLLLATPWTHRGMGAAFFLIGAIPLAAPALVEAVARPIRPRRLGLAYAVGSLSHRLASAGVAVAGLAVAVAMMVGITIMVSSFRESLAGWIERTVQADIYVSAAAWRGDRDAPGLDPGLLAALGSLEGVAAVDHIRGFRGRAQGRPVALRGVRLDLLEMDTRFQILRGPAEASAEFVFVSEPFARKTGLNPGDTLSLETPGGIVRPTVSAVVRDYGSEAGAITMDVAQMDRWFGGGDPHGAALYLEPGTDANPTMAQVIQTTRGYGLTVRANRDLRENALRIFDQTFRITLVLQGMALLIAAVGVTLTLLVLGTDEAGLLGLYRALGASRAQVFRFFVAKGIAIALLGTVLGVVGGFALAAVLVQVVNPTYFGWTLEFHVPAATLLRQALWVLLAAAAAALIPAAGASRPRTRALNPVEA